MKRVAGRAIIIQDDDVLLMFRRKIKDGKVFEYYGIPGGKQEDNETLEECTIREIKEELNLDVVIDRYLGYLEDDKNISHIFNVKVISKY